jgi:YVTN family beta-propeller protein
VVRITDAHSGEPISGLFPAGWLDLLPAEAEPADCKTKVAAFLGGTLLAKPEGDLNLYHVLALNDDASLTVVDPQFGFGGTKLLDLVELREPGGDWALGADSARLYVSQPESGLVAVVETATWDLMTYAEVGPRPGRVALQPDGRYLWVGYQEPLRGDAVGGVTVVDTVTMKAVGHVATGRGEHDLAFSDDSRTVFVTNRDDGTVSLVDVVERRVRATVATGAEPVSVAFSPLAQAAFVSHRGDGTIAVLETSGEGVAARIESSPGLGQIRFARDGRLALAVNPETDEVVIVDAARRRKVQTAVVSDGPDQVAFSDELAYLRHRDNEVVLMIPLSQVGAEGQPVPVIDFPGGDRPPGNRARPTPAAAIVQAPGAYAVLVANPEDRAIYYYKEGMAAPMGHFQNYGRRPRAVMVVDRSLRETTPGTYETVVPLHRPGSYEMALFLDSPYTVECLPFSVAEDAALAAARRRRMAAVVPVARPAVAAVGEELALRFRVTDPATGSPVDGLADVGVLGFLVPGVWQQRQWAEPLGGGVYEVRLAPPRPGIYYVFVQVPSLDVEYRDTRAVIFEARERAAQPAVLPAEGPEEGPPPSSAASTSSASSSSAPPPAPETAAPGSNS